MCQWKDGTFQGVESLTKLFTNVLQFLTAMMRHSNSAKRKVLGNNGNSYSYYVCIPQTLQFRRLLGIKRDLHSSLSLKILVFQAEYRIDRHIICCYISFYFILPDKD